MDEHLKKCFEDLGSTDDKLRMHALEFVLTVTEKPSEFMSDLQKKSPL